MVIRGVMTSSGNGHNSIRSAGVYKCMNTIVKKHNQIFPFKHTSDVLTHHWMNKRTGGKTRISKRTCFKILPDAWQYLCTNFRRDHNTPNSSGFESKGVVKYFLGVMIREKKVAVDFMSSLCLQLFSMCCWSLVKLKGHWFLPAMPGNTSLL